MWRACASEDGRLWGVAAGPRGTLDITQLRAVLRTIGCERLCTEVLQQLVELRRWVEGGAHEATPGARSSSAHTPLARRPPLPALHGMAVLEGERTRLSIGFGDFLRVLLSAKMRSFLGEMDFSHASMTLLQLSTAFDMAVDGQNNRVTEVDVVCMHAGTRT